MRRPTGERILVEDSEVKGLGPPIADSHGLAAVGNTLFFAAGVALAMSMKLAN